MFRVHFAVWFQLDQAPRRDRDGREFEPVGYEIIRFISPASQLSFIGGFRPIRDRWTRPQSASKREQVTNRPEVILPDLTKPDPFVNFKNKEEMALSRQEMEATHTSRRGRDSSAPVAQWVFVGHHSGHTPMTGGTTELARAVCLIKTNQTGKRRARSAATLKSSTTRCNRLWKRSYSNS